jgi:xanthine dehydrogenase molybdenum-binding subunit
VRKIDASAALAMPGVHAILTEEDLPEHDPLGETCVTNEPLYEGQAILAVAADSEWIAADAIEKIKVDLEPLPFALDPLDSLRPGGPNARRDGNVIVRDTPSEPNARPKNVVKEQKWTAEAFSAAGGARLPEGEAHTEWAIGDIAKGFAEADFVIDRPLYHQSNTHHPLEPRSCMAYWQGGKLYLYPSTQSITITHAVAAGRLGVSPQDYHLICEFCGGGFGSKILGTVNMPIPALLSKKTGRPVKGVFSRREEFISSTTRHPFIMDYKTGVDREGKILARQVRLVLDGGAYCSWSETTLGKACILAPGPYNIENLHVQAFVVYTNKTMTGAMRGFGAPQVCFAYESHMDDIAAALGIDPLEIRLRNAFGEGSISPTGQVLHSVVVKESLLKAAERFGWREGRQ